MDKDTRNRIQRATQSARSLLEEEYRQQLEGTYDVLLDGSIAEGPGQHLSAAEREIRKKIVAAIEHKRASGATPAAAAAGEAVAAYLREAAFTSLNRFVALKMLEARGLVQECVSKGEESSGFKEFSALAPGLATSFLDKGYRLYLESLFDEVGQEVRVLFDRRDPASLLWPRRQALLDLLAILNASELASVWSEDETIGWVYQFFNGEDERAAMRDVKRGGSQAPRNSRELAVRNQFFTPRYVVQFLTDNTLGRTWVEMHGESTELLERCEYLVRPVEDDDASAPSEERASSPPPASEQRSSSPPPASEERASSPPPARGRGPGGGPWRERPQKDPRDLRVLDPACGSGHFLLYAFDLLLVIYDEAWDSDVASEATGRSLRADYPDRSALRREAPRLILEHNLHGVDIDPRCAQIAALALWLRAQRAWNEAGIPPAERPAIAKTNIIVAEPMPGDAALVAEFARELDPPLLGDLFEAMVAEMRLAGEMGTLLKVDEAIADAVERARKQFVAPKKAFGWLPGLESSRPQAELDLSGITDEAFFAEAEARIVAALERFAERAAGAQSVRRRLFAGDASQGIALIELVRKRFDVVLMNPPFGAGSLVAKKAFEKSYPRTKNDVYAAFVERGIELLHPGGMLGAITSRTGFFLSSFQKWREEILLKEAPPTVFADLGYGVLDSAMVEVAAYCLEKAA